MPSHAPGVSVVDTLRIVNAAPASLARRERLAALGRMTAREHRRVPQVQHAHRRLLPRLRDRSAAVGRAQSPARIRAARACAVRGAVPAARAHAERFRPHRRPRLRGARRTFLGSVFAAAATAACKLQPDPRFRMRLRPPRAPLQGAPRRSARLRHRRTPRRMGAPQSRLRPRARHASQRGRRLPGPDVRAPHRDLGVHAPRRADAGPPAIGNGAHREAGRNAPSHDARRACHAAGDRRARHLQHARHRLGRVREGEAPVRRR